MSAADPTVAERARRHRERKRQEAQAQEVLEVSTAQALEALRVSIDALTQEVRALRNGGGQPRNAEHKSLRNGGGKPAPALRNGGAPIFARADAYPGVGSPPTGTHPTPVVSNATEDAPRVLEALTRPGSVASVADAAGVSHARAVAALVHLLGQGLVTRTPGDTTHHRPDLWAPVQDPALADLAEPTLRLAVEPTPTSTVTCSHYQAHATLGHRWDPARNAFRCWVCEPEGQSQ